MTDNFVSRLKVLQTQLSAEQAILLSRPADILYYTGFASLVPEEREAFCCVTATTVSLLHASFSPVQKIAGIAYTPVSTTSNLKTVAQQLISQGVREIYIDIYNIFVGEEQLLKSIPDLKISPLDRTRIWRQRQRKDAIEQQYCKEAGMLTVAAYRTARSLLREGITEVELAVAIECYIRQHTGTLAFPTIVAFGAHSSLPHHQPTTTALQAETAVLIDLGARVHGYCSDMTRTEWFGAHPDARFSEIQNAVTGAYAAAVELVGQPQLPTAAAVDAATRTHITTAGFGDAFIHTTGHGVGIDIHEQPSLYKSAETLLEHGMNITIEPGVYLSEQFGYRYENTLLLTPSGPEVLTDTQKE